MVKKIVCFLFLFYPLLILSQEKEYVQFSGFVRSNSGTPLPFVNVINLNTHKGTISDLKGMFSFITEKNDSILFSSVGFKKKMVVIPDTITSSFFNKDISMTVDTFEIEEVMIFPWKDYEEFKQAFIELDIEDKDMENAIKNIALLKTQIVLNVSADPGLNFDYVMQQQYNQLMNEGLQPTTQLLNPLAWGRFIEALKSGDLKDKNKELRKLDRKYRNKRK